MKTKLRINQNILKFEAQLVFPSKMAQQMSALGQGVARQAGRPRTTPKTTAANHNTKYKT